MRIPDVSFISRTQTPDGRFPQEQRIADLHPDLAVEILSNANTEEEMAEKRRDDFQSGARLVWIIDPAKRTAEIYTAADQRIEVADGVLTGEPVLAGLAIPLKTVFDVDGAL